MKGLSESLLKNIRQDDEYVRRVIPIEKWLEDYQPYIIRPRINDDFTIDAESVRLDNGIINGYEELPKYIEFNRVKSFSIAGENLKSLRGCPRTCIAFTIKKAPKLKSLVGGPIECDVYKINFSGINTLQGLPTKTNSKTSSLNIDACARLKSVEGDTGIFSEVIIRSTPKLKSLQGLKSGFKRLQLNFCGIENLSGCPRKVDRIEIHSCDNLKTLDGAPNEVFDFFCSNNQKLKNLQGSPKIVENLFFIDNNYNITSLEGSPKSVGSYIIHKSPFESFEGITQDIKTNLDCTDCSNIKSFKYLPRNLPVLACFMRSFEKRFIMISKYGQSFYSMDMITKWVSTPKDKIVNRHDDSKRKEYVEKYVG